MLTKIAVAQLNFKKSIVVFQAVLRISLATQTSFVFRFLNGLKSRKNITVNFLIDLIIYNQKHKTRKQTLKSAFVYEVYNIKRKA